MVVDLSAAPYVAGELVGTGIAALAARLTWRRRDQPGALALTATLWACVWWSFWHALSLLAATLPLKIGLANVWYVGAALVDSLMLIFALEYRRQARLPGWATALACLPGAATLLIVWTNPWHRLYWPRTFLVPGPPFTRFGLSLGPAALGFVGWECVALLTATILLLRVFFDQRGLFRRQVVFMLLGMAIPWASYALFATGHGLIPSYDITTLTLSLGMALIGWAVDGCRLLDVMPVAHRAVMSGISDAVLVIDDQDRVVYMNPAAQALAESSEPEGQALAQAMPRLAPLLDSPGGHAELVRGLGREQRVFDVRVSRLAGQFGARRRAIILRDDTDRRLVDHLQHSRQQVIAAEENLRRRMAEFLHGPVQTRLFAAWVRLGEYQERGPLLTAEESALMLASIREEIDLVREHDIRLISQLLYPPSLRLGLLPAIEHLAGGFEDFFSIDVEASDALREMDAMESDRLSEEPRLVIYRVIEEALSNAAKHASCSRVDICLSAIDGMCQARITDDGRGFEPSRAQPGFGFGGIAGRVEQLGGSWEVRSQPGQGTSLSVIVPLVEDPRSPALRPVASPAPPVTTVNATRSAADTPA